MLKVAFVDSGLFYYCALLAPLQPLPVTQISWAISTSYVRGKYLEEEKSLCDNESLERHGWYKKSVFSLVT